VATARSRSRNADIKLLAGATIGVLLAGLFIAGAAWVATRDSKSAVCGQLSAGAASEVRKTLESGGPYPSTGGASCGFWLALDNDNIVAYRWQQPSGCTLKWKRDHWECGGLTLNAADLAQYPVSIQSVQQNDVVVVDLGPQTPTTTPTTSHP